MPLNSWIYVRLICDSDMRPSPTFAREMVRPYVNPSVNVTTAARGSTPPGPGLAAHTYTALEGFSPMLLAFGLITYVWGGCFSIRRKAFDEWNLAKLWRGTEDDDLILCGKLNEHRQKAFFVPSAVSPSFEVHATVRSLVRWFIRQGQATRLHYFGVWLLLLVVETAVSLGLLGAVAVAVVALSFWLAIDPKMRWGKMTLEFNRDGTIREIRNRHE